jgi:tRNA-2-methylthio-N6-dimethylallyladenosine synthase
VPVRRYFVTTFGCQMNAHDSERIKGMLEDIGLGEAPSREEADVIVFNTCTIREKPDTKFAAYIGDAIAQKRRSPDTVIAVGGCYAEAQRERLFSLYPEVDIAFGPGSIPHLGEWLGAGGFGVERSAFGITEERRFASTLPMHRERRFQAWVQISMGCNSKCAYCIVPAVRGREVSRRPGEILAEVAGLAAEGVKEITLLGQNVNSWGRDLGSEFGELLRACDGVDGIERIRFTSPHPKDLRPETIAAMAECARVCEHLHLPLQSGSDRTLARMHRGYTAARYLERLAAARAEIDDLAVTTDIIVGFPGETDDDFARTLEVVDAAEYDAAYTFVFSPRPGTEAAEMVEDFVPAQVAKERMSQLVDVVERHGLHKHEARVGRVERLLVEGPSKRDADVWSGRTMQNKLVHFAPDDTTAAGDVLDVRITSAAPHFLRGDTTARVQAAPRRRVRIPLEVV